MPLRLAILVLVVAFGSACASSPERRAVLEALDAGKTNEALARYEAARGRGQSDPEWLSKIAERMLLDAAESPRREERDAAFLELSLAGTHAENALLRLSDTNRPAVVRAHALAVRARAGDHGAMRVLVGFLQADDPEVLARAVRVARASQERERLRGWLTHPAAEVRSAAAWSLRAAGDRESRLALVEAAHRDPDPGVRAAAVDSLAAYGPITIDALRERMRDSDIAVRMTALGALSRVGGDAAPEWLRLELSKPLDPVGVEAARLLFQIGGDADREDARALLRRALVAGMPVVRAQAAIAILSVPRDEALNRAVAEALANENDAAARLAMARALLHHDVAVDAARRALADLLSQENMAALQAASILALDRLPSAVERLSRGLTSDSPRERAVAARALARDARLPDAARDALRDPDPIVRIRAAGGILAAGAR